VITVVGIFNSAEFKINGVSPPKKENAKNARNERDRKPFS